MDWRKRARELIDFTNRRLHPSLGENQRREALERACPTGYHSGKYYSIWLEEVQRALDAPAPAPARVEQAPSGLTCGFCGYPRSLGCPFCYELRKSYGRLHPEEKANDD